MSDSYTIEQIIRAFRKQWPHIEDGEPLEPYEQGILDDLLAYLKAENPSEENE